MSCEGCKKRRELLKQKIKKAIENQKSGKISKEEEELLNRNKNIIEGIKELSKLLKGEKE